MSRKNLRTTPDIGEINIYKVPNLRKTYYLAPVTLNVAGSRDALKLDQDLKKKSISWHKTCEHHCAETHKKRMSALLFFLFQK